MIYTITLNPSIDKHITVEKLIKDDALRSKSMHRDPGGKGINVSRVVKELGGDTRAFGIVGGCAGYMLRDLLERNEIEFKCIEVIGETRINVIITDLSDMTQTRISNPGPKVDFNNIGAFVKLIDSVQPRPSFWVLGGSLPPGVPKETYRDCIQHLQSRGERCVLDADGEALAAGIEAAPFLIKPNEYELERLLGKKIDDEKEIVKAARQFCDKGVEVVIISLGGRGAIVVTKDQAFKLESPKVEVCSKVGAGDSVIGGFLFSLKRGDSMEEAARYGVAAGTAAVITEGTKLCLRKDVDRLVRDVVCVEI